MKTSFTILSIENHPEDQLVIREILEKEGMTVVSIPSLLRAAHHLGTHPGEYCFILSDWELPPYKGEEIVETLSLFRTPFGFFTDDLAATPAHTKYPIWSKHRPTRMAQGIHRVLKERIQSDETQRNLLRPGWFKDPRHGIKPYAPADLENPTEPQQIGLGT